MEFLYNCIKKCINMDPALATIAAAGIGAAIDGISTGIRNKRAKQAQKEANQQAIQNRLREDADKVQSLKMAGLNPALASAGANTTPVATPPADVEKAEIGDKVATASGALGSILQNQPLVDEQVKQSASVTQANEANANKANAEADAIRQNIADKTGENQGAYFKLNQFGLKPSDLKVENASGYLRSLDFGDEHITKGAERGLRKLSAQLDSQIKTKCLTDSDWNKKFQGAYAAGLESLMLDPQLKSADLTSKKQNNALFNLRKLNLNAEYKLKLNQSSKTSIESLKGLFDIEKVKAETKIAYENSFQNILSHIHSAYVRDDAEELADWLIIGGVKSGGFNSLIQMFHSVTSDSMDAIKLYLKLKK